VVPGSNPGWGTKQKGKIMGPEDNTPKWHKQVETIVTVIKNSGLTSESEIDRVTIMYAMDESFSRSAILEARRKILNG
jgi:hypothetical protein